MGKSASRGGRGRDPGISLLLEVIIGLGVFLLAFLFVYGVFPMSQRALVESRNQIVATNIAREYMEAERDQELSRVALGEGQVVVTDTPRRFRQQVEGRESPLDYRVTITGDDGPVPGTRLVQVTVSWRYGGLDHNTRLESIVGSRVPKR